MPDFIAKPCPACCELPPPPGQPCITSCPQCRLGTKGMRFRVTVNGVTNRAAAQFPAVGNVSGQYVPAPTCMSTVGDWQGDVVTDLYGCLALNGTFDSPTCPNLCGGDIAAMCVLKGSCDPGTYVPHTIEAYCNPNMVGSAGINDPYTNYGTIGFPAGFNPALSTSFRRYEVLFKFPSTCLQVSPDWSIDTRHVAVFRKTGEEADTEATSSDCRGVKALTQIRNEGALVPCDFSGATVTVEVLEYYPTVPNTIFLSIASTGSLNGEVVQLDWDEGLAQWLGSAVVGGCTVNFYFACNGTIANPCDAQPNGNFKLSWDSGGGCTVTSNITAAIGTTTFFPFLWEDAGETITINGVGQTCDFTITE